MDKTAAGILGEYSADYAKRAVEIDLALTDAGLSKKAEEVIPSLNKREKMLFKKAEEFGRGLARGQLYAFQEDEAALEALVGDMNQKIGEDMTDILIQAILVEDDDGVEKTAEAEDNMEAFGIMAEAVEPIIISKYGGEEAVNKAIEEDPDFEFVINDDIVKTAALAIIDLNSTFEQTNEEVVDD